ncbi:MAG: transglycosylase domain-containing protein, partial [Patescibacteria group bacterium]|nr:transglycosylase domain-containing protein [Patescibacteria group bacterium]
PQLKIKYPKPKLKLSLFQKIILTLILLFFIIFYWLILKDLPKPTDLSSREPTLSTKIYDRNNQLLFTFYKDQNRSLVNLEAVPDHFIKATLAIEDSQFYKHNGVSLKGILRSIDQIIFNQQLHGGSTITQQLIKNALLSQERTIIRKLKELILSLEVEILFSKNEILEMYLNEVSYGGTAYGVEQAAQTYFAKSIKDLNLAESALLAGLPASPTTYSPFGLNPHLSIYRQHQVLNRMVEEKFIAPLEAELAKKQIIKLAPQFTNIKAPHFVMFVKDLLVKEYGQALVEQGGLTVITSLDFKLHQSVQQIVSKEIIKVAPLNITNGAALVTKPKTGEILSMVGSRDYFDTDRDGQVNVVTSLRQPGSAIKPINYSLALENNYTAASVIKDTPVTYDIAGSKPYSPVNYDGRFHGSVTLRSALANSYNIPAVKLLANLGVDKMIEQGKKLGITTWNQPERYGLSLTLGGAEIKMTDMAVVFATFANLGQKVNLHPVLKVTDSKGKTLMDLNCDQVFCNPNQVINSNIAYIISDILSDTYARSPAFGLSSYLNIPNHQVAVKTGTTNDKRDNWTIGYTTDYLTAVWVGNNDNSPMSQVASGITGASPIWHNIMVKILEGSEPSKFSPPTDLIKVDICPITGQLSCEGCGGKIEYFTPGTQPTIHCKSEYIKQLKEEKDKKDQEQRDKILQGTSIHSQ